MKRRLFEKKIERAQKRAKQELREDIELKRIKN